jgi:chemotaxis methyl-accepting protein methylase
MDGTVTAAQELQWACCQQDILGLLEQKRGLDFTAYRPSTVGRRLRTRMAQAGCRAIEQYLQLLRREEREVDRLVEHLTIKISRFFRNPSVFESLRGLLAQTLAERGQLRIWSAGCGRGEEAYSLAILLEQLSRSHRALQGQVVGTDVDPAALEAARRGWYEPKALEHATPEVLRDHFRYEPTGGATVLPAVRARVQFVQHDLLEGRAPHGAPFDLICCRNVLIYFERKHVDRVQRYLAGCLRPGGVLCLGEAEYVSAGVAPLLEIIDARSRLFRVRCADKGRG